VTTCAKLCRKTGGDRLSLFRRVLRRLTGHLRTSPNDSETIVELDSPTVQVEMSTLKDRIADFSIFLLAR
jgi:hypothetical protein